MTRSLTSLALVSAILLAGCGRVPTEFATTETPAPGASDGSVAGDTAAPDASDPQSTTCDYVATGKAAKPVSPPVATEIATSGTVTYLMKMTSGEVRLTLDRSKAPCTVNSFSSLADQGFYDKTRCHGLSDTGTFLLLCGDPTAKGSGGPGYQFADETDGTEQYRRGVVAMANAGPDANGSQFFLFWDDSPSLDAEHQYTIFGTMDDTSIDVVASIGGQGRDEKDAPIAPADIVSISKQ